MSETPDFQDMSGVGPSTAEKLEEAGFESYQALATKSPGELAEEADVGENRAKDIISAARENADVGGFSNGMEVKERRENVGKISLLVDEFDELMGGGFETQSISEVYGEFGAGKSQITHQLAVNVQLDEEHGGVHGRCLFLDTEDTFRPERIDDMVRGLSDEILEHEMEKRGIEGSVDDEDAMEALVEDFLDKIAMAQAFNSNHQMLLAKDEIPEMCNQYSDSDFPVRLIVVDSLMAHFRAEYVGRGELAERQQKLNEHLHDIAEPAKLHDAAAIITNQVQDNPDQMFGDPTKPIGGNILGHTSTFRVYIRKSKDNKRVTRLVDAPNLADGEAVLRVTDDGIKPE